MREKKFERERITMSKGERGETSENMGKERIRVRREME